MRVIWLCEEVGVDYDVTKIDFSMEYRATAEWRKLSPVGKVPILVDDNMIMFESGAMVQYVIDKYTDRSLVPAVDSPEYGHYLQWLWFAEATLARPLGEIVNHGREFPGDQRIPAVTTEMANRAAACLSAVAEHMQNRQYLVGERFTAADVMTGYSILIAEALIPDQIPANLAPYWQRLQARPAFATARAI